MLPPFIIEEIRKRERQEQARDEQPRLELPLGPGHVIVPSPSSVKDDDDGRGVLVIDL